ncbi:MAG TPA: metallopeptidase TldD-related protein [Terriglobia bacterium]|nr:metallopeptidase TldD-related protein [Terriglobia bacterium]
MSSGSDNLRELAQEVVREARNAGASEADALILEEEAFSVTVRLGEVETLKESISRTLRLRVFDGKRTAASQTSDLTPAVVRQLVAETVEMARRTSEDPSSGLPDASLFASTFPDLELLDPEWDALSPADRIAMARRAEAAAMAADPSIVNSEGGSFDYSRSRTVLANTFGFLGDYAGTAGSISAVPITQTDGAMQRDYWFSTSRRVSQLESPEAVGRRAAERALRRVGARKVKTCEAAIVFDPLTARGLMGHLFQAVAGDAIYRRGSFLVDRLGSPVAAPSISVLDNALLKGGLGSSPFDDEGVPSQTTRVIDRGTLGNYLHSAYTARKLGSRPTGNGARTGAGSMTVGPSNFYLEPGTHSPDEIIANTKSGLYVFEMIGSGVNLVNGDYSRGAAGLWIENGKLTYPVHEITISGNLKEMLQSVDMIGNDLLFMGNIASPTVRIPRMVISGE